MVCPNCGNVLSDNSTSCFACGTPIINPNVQQMNNQNQPLNTIPTAPTQVPVDDNSIAIPQDFVLAGGTDDSDLVNDLPDSMANLLNKEAETQKKPEKKKRKIKIKKIIKSVLTLVIIVVLAFVGYNVYLGYTTPKYDLSCTLKGTENGIVYEYIYQYSFDEEQGYVNSFETIKVYNENLMPLAQSDLNTEMAKLGSIGYKKTGVLEDGKVVITYYASHYDVKSLHEVSVSAAAGGFTCEVPKSVGIKLPFFN